MFIPDPDYFHPNPGSNNNKKRRGKNKLVPWKFVEGRLFFGDSV
jgi:hypothetical protein